MNRLWAIAAAAVALSAISTAADAGTRVICDPKTGDCTVIVDDPGAPGGRGGSGGSHQGGGGGKDPTGIPCHTVLASLQPPASDPIWSGHPPGTGSVYVKVCPLRGRQATQMLWLPKGTVVPVVTPAQLAREALATLRLPMPTVERSPSQANSDHGVPYTWVNLWTWYWTAPSTWQPLAKTARVGPVWATVTARPTALVFEPGDGSAAASCPGPGRPWTKRDGNAAPSSGGCGFVYRHVSTGTVTSKVSLRWEISWTGSGGAGGTMPAMATGVTSAPFLVEQIQAVNR